MHVYLRCSCFLFSLFFFIFSLDFGLMVRQRGFRTTLKAPTAYANLLCGICGDWDGNRGNDEGRDLSVFQEPESVGQE